MEQLQFSIQTLLSKKDGKIKGPMSPTLFATEMAQQLHLRFNRLARVWFKDDMIFQRVEYGEKTGFDTLVVGYKSKHDLWLSLWIDEGTKGIPVALAFAGEEPDISPIYRQAEYARKLSDAEIRHLFDHIFQNAHLLDIDNQEAFFTI